MLLVIMTRSLIRLGNTVRASLNNDCMTNSYDDRRGKARTESDRDITRGCRGYNAGTREVELEIMIVLTRSYRRYNEKL